MEGLKFETEINQLKLKELWEQFLIKKYQNEELIPKEPRDEDWDEFTEKLKSEIKQNVINRMYPDASTKEKEEIKRQIKIDFEKVEKNLLSAQ
jgi:nicotinamide mononucleotide adenylyltransferase